MTARTERKLRFTGGRRSHNLNAAGWTGRGAYVTAKEAEQVYVRMMRSLGWFGSHPVSGDASDSEAGQIRDALEQARADVHLRRKEDGAPWWVAECPSCWHAALYLTGLNESFRRDMDAATALPLVFRGHADRSWEIVPSVQRPGVDQMVERRVFRAFKRLCLCVYLELESFWPAPAIETHAATAQHYGIRTNLIDLTTDPFVAIAFACMGHHPGSQACVFAIPLPLARRLRGNVTLPHLYTRRLYRQRGLFLHTPRPAPAAIRAECTEVLFPHNAEFQVYRHGEPIDLLPPDAWIAGLIDEARDWVRQHGDAIPRKGEAGRILAGMKARGISFPDGAAKSGHEMDEYLDINELIFDLVMVPGGRGFRVNAPSLDLLVEGNLPFMKAFLDLLETMSPGPGVSDSLRTLLRDSLRRRGILGAADVKTVLERVHASIGMMTGAPAPSAALDATHQPATGVTASLAAVSELSVSELNALAATADRGDPRGRYAREEQLLSQLSGIERSLLTEVLGRPDGYTSLPTQVRMISRRLVNNEARRLYRGSNGIIGPELAEELRFSFHQKPDADAHVEEVRRSITAGAERPLEQAAFAGMAIRLGSRLFAVSAFEQINAELKSAGSLLRYTGTDPAEAAPFSFVLFALAPDAPARDTGEEEDDSGMRTFEIYCELVRSPALAPDVNLTVFPNRRFPTLNVWKHQLPREFFEEE